ncbi:hypothetical protein, partial [Nocardioides sp.]|uniref:hypothetical protein n=1 Tax=Nocardioides sp. TaxID=35761 RepID=UPI0027327E11
QKVGTGEHGMKADRAQKLLDEACAKVADWKTTPEAATELEAAAKEALGPFLKGIVITRGHLSMFDVDRSRMAAAKASRKADGKAVLDERDESGGGGQAEDNTRRRMVADALRTELKAYAAELRAAAEPSKKSPLAMKSRAERRSAGGPERTVTVVRLQKILDRGLKRVRADVNNSIGDAAIADAVKLYLPMVKDLDVQGLRVTRLDVATTFFKDAQESRAASAAALQAQLDIAGELQNTPGLSQPFVQAVLNRYLGKFTGLDADDRDEMLTMAVTNALADRLQELEIKGGKVLRFTIKAVAPAGGK